MPNVQLIAYCIRTGPKTLTDRTEVCAGLDSPTNDIASA